MKLSYKYSSPNFSSRHNTAIDTIVIHHTGGSFPGCALWLCDKDSRVSAHAVINKRGQCYELVKPEYCAWHAGRGAYDLNGDGTISDDEKSINRRSIGIELESMGDNYTTSQMIALIWLIIHYRQMYNEIVSERIIGHKELAPDRKWDPGNFNMQYLRQCLMAFKRIRHN